MNNELKARFESKKINKNEVKFNKIQIRAKKA